MIESTRAASGASAVDRCEIITDHGPGEASDLLRGGLGGPGLGHLKNGFYVENWV